MAYISLTSKAICPEGLAKAKKEAEEELGEGKEGADGGALWNPDGTATAELDGETLTLNEDMRNMGFVSIRFTLTDEIYVGIIERAIKKMNKFKSVLESLK